MNPYADTERAEKGGKSQVVVGFLRNTGMNPSQFQLLLEGSSYGPL